MIQHEAIWRAIDELAAQNGLSPSGLAKKAGLSSTIFNISKRSHKGRKRWPSTESIALILKATNTSFDAFVALTEGKTTPQLSIPLLSASAPTEATEDETRLPNFNDEELFAIEIDCDDFEPFYREGDKLWISPSSKARKGDAIVLCHEKGRGHIGSLIRETTTKIEYIPLGAREKIIVLRKDLPRYGRIVAVFP
jgi:phage repressor protein C with HTH and peptisase S24 domain